jgi:hypothetical protein
MIAPLRLAFKTKVLNDIEQTLSKHGELTPKELHNFLPQYSYFVLRARVATGSNGLFISRGHGKYGLRTTAERARWGKDDEI